MSRSVNTILILVGVALLVFIGLRMLRGGTHPLEGKPAPAFTAETLDGESVDLTAMLGEKVVVLDFWASWCPPCRKGLPVVAEMAREFADKPVAVYGVNVGEPAEQVRGFLAKAELDLEVALDPDGVVAQEYGVRGIPQTVVIGRDGIVHEVHVGLSFNFDGTLRGAIEDALAPSEEPVSDM